MKCPIETYENAALLLDYVDRKLDAETAAVLERHMEVCPACREFRDTHQIVWSALDEWEAAPVPADFDRRLYRRIEEEAQSSWWERFLQPLRTVLFRPVLPLAATACLLLVGGLLLQMPSVRPVPGAGDDNSRARDVEQVERTLEDMEMLRQFNLVTVPEGEDIGSRPM